MKRNNYREWEYLGGSRNSLASPNVKSLETRLRFVYFEFQRLSALKLTYRISSRFTSLVYTDSSPGGHMQQASVKQMLFFFTFQVPVSLSFILKHHHLALLINTQYLITAVLFTLLTLPPTLCTSHVHITFFRYYHASLHWSFMSKSLLPGF